MRLSGAIELGPNGEFDVQVTEEFQRVMKNKLPKSQRELTNLILNMAFNDYVMNFEIDKFMLGDPAFYKTMEDRDARWQRMYSTGPQIRRADAEPLRQLNFVPYQQTAHGVIVNSGLRKAYFQYFKEANPEATDEEINEKINEELKGYKDVDMFDGAAFIRPRAYANIMYQLGYWNQEVYDGAMKYIEAREKTPSG